MINVKLYGPVYTCSILEEWIKADCSNLSDGSTVDCMDTGVAAGVMINSSCSPFYVASFITLFLAGVPL